MIKLKIKYGNESADIRFPCSETEMSAALEKIHAEDVTPLEVYVAEAVFPEELGFLQDRFVNLDEINFLGKRMDAFFGDEEYQFYEAMKSEGFDTLPDLINLSFNLNRYPFIRDIGDKAMYYLHLAAEHDNQYAAQLIHSIRVNGNWTAALASLRLLGHIAHIIKNRIEDKRKGGGTDRKLLKKIEEKKQAQGLKQ